MEYQPFAPAAASRRRLRLGLLALLAASAAAALLGAALLYAWPELCAWPELADDLLQIEDDDVLHVEVPSVAAILAHKHEHKNNEAETAYVVLIRHVRKYVSGRRGKAHYTTSGRCVRALRPWLLGNASWRARTHPNHSRPTLHT